MNKRFEKIINDKIDKLDKEIIRITEENKDKEFKNILSMNEIRYIRMKNLLFIKDLVEKIEFIEGIEEVKDYVSKYNVFCDREKFYYDTTIKDKNDKEFTEIVACELFNSLQYPRKVASSSTLDLMLGQTLLMMYSIGIIDEKLPYGESARKELINKIDYSKYSVFHPSKEAMKYLFEKLKVKSNDGGHKLYYYNIKYNGFIAQCKELK